MKNLIVITSLCFTLQIMAQTTPTVNPGPPGSAAEAALNQTLLDNSGASQKILQNSASSTTPSDPNFFTQKNGNASPNLTDQEKQLSENFIDQAGANKIIKEKCVGQMEQACAGGEVDHKIMGMSPGIIKAAAQAYATIGAVSDSILPISAPSKSPDTEAAAGNASSKGPEEKAEKPTDYCKYIPAASEAISVYAQTNTVQNLTNNGVTSQKDQLLKAAKSHDGRAEQAQIQAVGWYGGAACYAVNAGIGKFAIDTNLIVKLSAAAFLGTVYQMEVKANKDYAQKIRDIANSLPNKGDCNPITENDCYCATPEYANDPVNCKAQLATKNAPSNFSRVACMDDTLKLDPSCTCEKTNSCLDKFLENHGAIPLPSGTAYSNSPFTAVTSLAKGQLESGSMTSSPYAASAAIAKKAIQQFMPKVSGITSPLNLSQKEVANAFASQGIPLSVAQLMAQTAPPKNAIANSMGKFSNLGRSNYSLPSSDKNHVLEFSGGNGLGLGGVTKTENKNDMADFLKKLNGGKGGPINSKILEFSAKAQARAIAQSSQISSKDRPLFEIISARYKISGRRLLKVDLGE